MALKNLALAASNDTTILPQLTSVNLALTALVTLLTAANKKLANALVGAKAAQRGRQHRLPGKVALTNKPFLENYSWTHSHWVNQNHTSATCRNNAVGHKDKATSAKMMGSSEADKGWNSHA